MKLHTAELRASLPPLYSQEHNQDPVVRCKFFTPWSNWTWPKASQKRTTSASLAMSAATTRNGAILSSPNWRASAGPQA